MYNPNHSRGGKASPEIETKVYRPYFTTGDMEFFGDMQRKGLTFSQEQHIRQNACSFIEVVGRRLGFPRRTISTAQNLYHRFHICFPRKAFNYFDVSLATLYVSTKVHDTLKKPRDLLSVSYAIRFPELAAKSKHPGGEIDLDSMDPQVVENDRQRILSIERLILETLCFNFRTRLPYPYVIKIGRALGATKQLTKLAWRIVIDCYRTLLPLQYPPHTIALGCLYIACLLSTFEQPPSNSPERHIGEQVIKMLSSRGEWEQKFQSQVEDLEDIGHSLLDLFIHFAQNPSASTSPSTPSSPSPHLSRHSSHHHHHHSTTNETVQPPPYNADQLLRMKIALRETEHPPRRRYQAGADLYAYLMGEDLIMCSGKNEGTTRFLFASPEAGGQTV